MDQDRRLNQLEFERGSIIAGRYETVNLLGKGSYGHVYLCRDRRNGGRPLAVKVIPATSSVIPFLLTRFDSEVALSSRLSHPRLVRLFDTVINYDVLAFTMEYLAGGSLDQLLKAHGPLPLNDAYRLLIQVADGLQAIHACGIVHNDLKPSNVLLTTELDAKIADFGISGEKDKLIPFNCTRVFGTAQYMAPEYLQSGIIDFRSDIYAFGILAYEMLGGSSPFAGRNSLEALTRTLKLETIPLQALRKDVPLSLSRLVQRCMSKDRDQRFQSAAHLHEALIRSHELYLWDATRFIVQTAGLYRQGTRRG